MYSSSTDTYRGNEPRHCNGCGWDYSDCQCIFFDDFLEEEHKRAVKIPLKTQYINPAFLVRKMPHSISGFRGLALRKRMDK